MPYRIQSQGDQFCVVKEATGESVGCHPSKEKATSHLKALYANVHDSAVQEFSMAIVKATVKDGEMRWRSVNSDTGEDSYGEKMSKELFQDFVEHIKNGDEIPEPFKSVICEEEWCGGMPYISLAHYRTGKGKVNVPGEPRNVYLDGDALKSTGVLYDTPLGRAVFKSLQKDLVEKREDKVRISIGFLDMEHSHGEKYTFTRKALTDKCPLCKEGVGDKIYKKGHLVHLALTRVPANPRTDMEVEKSMTTKREDAESIVEDEEVIKSLELKSQAEDVLVVKAEEKEMDCKEGDEECEKMHKEEKSAVENTVSTQPVLVPAVAVPTPEVIPAPEPTPLEKSFAALKDRVTAIKSQGLTGDNALKELQSSFDELGSVLRTEFTPSPQEIANQNLEATLRSLTEQVQSLVQIVAPMQSELSELRALSLVKQPAPKREEVPQPRSLNSNLVQRAAIENVQKKASQFDQLARQSVGLPN